MWPLHGLIQINERKFSVILCPKEGRPEMRFYFDVRDGVPVRDNVGREFKFVSEAIEFSKEFAAALRKPGTRRDLCVAVLNEHGSVVHEEPVFGPTSAN